MAKSGRSGGFSKSQAKALMKNIDNEISKVNKAVQCLQKDLNAIQDGETKNGKVVALWSGERAYSWISKALLHLDHDKVLLDHLAKCNEWLSFIINGGSSL